MEKQRPYITVMEIARRWNVNVTTVRRALDSGRNPLRGYKSPEDCPRGVWLISVESVVRRWGMPLF